MWWSGSFQERLPFCWHRGPPLLSKAVSFQLEALVVVLVVVQQPGVVLSRGVVSVDVPRLALDSML